MDQAATPSEVTHVTVKVEAGFAIRNGGKRRRRFLPSVPSSSPGPCPRFLKSPVGRLARSCCDSAAPKTPQVVLYDQYNNASATATLSATFTDFPTFSSDLADDFVVPAGQTWNVQSIDADGVYFNGAGPATSWNVFIYTNSGSLPGHAGLQHVKPASHAGGHDLYGKPGPAAVLAAGTYWIEIQANMTFGTQGEWGWTDRTVLSNSPAALQNPGGGFGCLHDLDAKAGGCIPTAGGPDQVYRLNGTTGGGGHAHSLTPTGTPATCSNYNTTTGTGTITAGTTDTGNHCDDCSTAVSLPFPVSVYGQTFNSANVASNGSLDLIGTQAPFTHGCQVLPSTLWTMAILPYQDDLRTDNLSFTGCNAFPGATCGVFTSVTGTAPNRQFNIEWRAVHFADTTTSVNFEVVLNESQTSFDVIYGATSDSGLDETSGVQASSTGPATTFSCGTATLTNGLKVTYTCAGSSQSDANALCLLHAEFLPRAHRVFRRRSAYSASVGDPSRTQCDRGRSLRWTNGTPTLAQLQPYQIVVPYSNSPVLRRGYAW